MRANIRLLASQCYNTPCTLGLHCSPHYAKKQISRHRCREQTTRGLHERAGHAPCFPLCSSPLKVILLLTVCSRERGQPAHAVA